jgi:diguanylate cyclase (GGDEF)-like protein
MGHAAIDTRRTGLRRRLDAALERVLEIYGARRCVLVALDGGGSPARSLGARQGPALWRAGVSRVRATGKPILVRNDPTRWAAWFPLRVGRGLAGVLYLEGEGTSGPAHVRDLRFAGFVAEHIALLLERVRLHEAAARDRLTGLHDHAALLRHFRRELRVARRSGGRCALLLFDVDEFRKINETCGHDAGSKILKRVARQISAAVREEDPVARTPHVGRYGGDEFEVVLPGAPRDAALRRADRVVRSVGGRRMSLGGRAVRVTLSAGVAAFPEDGRTAGELFRVADQALYEAKHGGKNRAGFSSANV